jgi:hypothetical protein
MENNKPTTEQIEALRKYAAGNGRCWKSQLHDAWMAGGYDASTGSYIDGPLQQIRNQFGPSWLMRFSLTKAA